MCVIQAEHKLKPFQGARVCFHGFPEEEQRHMTEVLIENGGTHTDIEDPVCSHLVSCIILSEYIVCIALRFDLYKL